MGATRAESALSEVVTDAIRGKKVSKWVIQLLLIFGIAVVIRQSFEVRGIGFFWYLSIVFGALLLSFLLSFHYRKWLETVIKHAMAKALDHDNATEFIDFLEEVLGERKSILDLVNLNKNALRMTILGISNTLFIVFLFLLGDAFIANVLVKVLLHE